MERICALQQTTTLYTWLISATKGDEKEQPLLINSRQIIICFVHFNQGPCARYTRTRASQQIQTDSSVAPRQPQQCAPRDASRQSWSDMA